MKQIAIYGAGAIARQMIRYNERYHLYEVVCLIDDDKSMGNAFMGFPVMSFSRFVERFSTAGCPEVIVGIGYTGCNQYRELACERVRKAGFRMCNFIAPGANCWSDTMKGENIIVFDNAFVGVDCELNDGVIISEGTVLSHGVKVGAYAFFSDGVVVGGNAVIGKSSFLGLNATIKSSVHLGEYNIVGSAANVIHDTHGFSVTIGNPGKTTEKDTIHTKI